MLSHPPVPVIESALASTMEQKNFGVSTNNIPISDRKEYNIQLIKSVNRFVNRVRWKVFFLFNPEAKGKEKNTFGLKSQKKAPKTPKYLADFEKELHRLVKEVKHRDKKDIQSDFLRELDKKVKLIKSSPNVFVAADKSSNYYEMSKEHHNQLLMKAINKDYKKADKDKVDVVNKGAKKISDHLEISDRVFKLECHQFVLICRGVGSREQSERGRVPIREIFTDILQTAAIRTFQIYSHYLQLHQMYILWLHSKRLRTLKSSGIGKMLMLFCCKIEICKIFAFSV